MQILLRGLTLALMRYTRFLLPILYQTRRTKKFNHGKGIALFIQGYMQQSHYSTKTIL